VFGARSGAFPLPSRAGARLGLASPVRVEHAEHVEQLRVVDGVLGLESEALLERRFRVGELIGGLQDHAREQARLLALLDGALAVDVGRLPQQLQALRERVLLEEVHAEAGQRFGVLRVLVEGVLPFDDAGGHVARSLEDARELARAHEAVHPRDGAALGRDDHDRWQR